MDNTTIYENFIMTTCFSKLKSIRNGWSEEKSDAYGLATIIDIGGSDYRTYDFIMDRCEAVVLEMIPYLIMELIKAYGIEAKWYQIKRNDAHVYSVSEKENWPDYVEQSNRQTVFAFSCEDDAHKGILYIFKEFGIGNHLPKSLVDTILSENKLNHYCYISIVDKDAYKEDLNHNDNPNDPSRGTRLFSMEQFFNSFFGKEEYAIFKRYADDLTKKVKDYYGFEIVRTLKPNTLHNFRKTVRDDLYSFDISVIDTDRKISTNQRRLIEDNYFEKHNCELLTGASDFAQSYMTAEWLFSSLAEAGNIDLTSIAMGYFKSIEQLLFCFIKQHTIEKDGVSRKIYAGKDGLVDLTDELVQNDEKTKDINLGSITGFFGYYKEDRNQYLGRNRDLLATGVDEDTYEYIIDVLTGVVGLRNGFFHKHNLTEWEKIVEVRNKARLVFYLILGAYKISEQDKTELGMIKRNDHDDYYKLCKYINDGGNNTKAPLKFPIFYLDNQDDEYDFWLSVEDAFIEYDNFGEPKFSGLYFKRIGKDERRILKITQDNLPKTICEGILSVSRSVPIEIKPSGPQTKVFVEGKFLL